MAQYARRHKRRHYDRNFMLSGLADKAQPADPEPIAVDVISISADDAALLEAAEHIRLELATVSMVGEWAAKSLEPAPSRPVGPQSSRGR